MDSVLVWNRSRKLFLKRKFTNQVRPLKNIDCSLKWFVRPSEVSWLWLFCLSLAKQAKLCPAEPDMYCSAGLLFREEGRGGSMHHMTSWSCFEPFLVVGLVGYFYILLGKTRFQPVWLINFFSWPQTRLKWFKSSLSILCKNYSKELPCCDQKWLKNVFYGGTSTIWTQTGYGWNGWSIKRDLRGINI